AQVTGTRRIIVLSDDWLPDRISADVAALAKLVPGILVHAGTVAGGSGEATRDDTSVLAALARATEGVGFRRGSPPVRSLGGLVRARTLDNLQIKAPGWRQRRESSCGDVLAEGTDCVWWAEGDTLADAIVVEGDVWGHHVTRVLQPDRERATGVARAL